MEITANNKVFKVDFIENDERVKIIAENGKFNIYAIQTDKKGNKYFYLPDLTTFGTKDYSCFYFFDKPADAVNAIFDGWADACIISGNPFGSIFSANRGLSPIYFIDRTVGEQMRAKSIAGWKTKPKYKWAIVRTNKNSFSANEHYLRDDYQNLPGRDNFDKAYFMFEHFLNVDSAGNINSHKAFDDIILPKSKIYMADTEEEAKTLIPEVLKKMIDLVRSACDDNSDKQMMKEYTYQPQQFILGR